MRLMSALGINRSFSLLQFFLGLYCPCCTVCKCVYMYVCQALFYILTLCSISMSGCTDQAGGGTRSGRLKPVFTALTVYRLKLTLSSQEASGAVPLGVVPTFTRKESLTDESRWLGRHYAVLSYDVLSCASMSCGVLSCAVGMFFCSEVRSVSLVA